MQKEDSAGMCIMETVPKVDKNSTQEELKKSFDLIDERNKEVNDLVINNDLRKTRQEEIYKKYMTGFASPSGNYCDIKLSLLPN